MVRPSGASRSLSVSVTMKPYSLAKKNFFFPNPEHISGQDPVADSQVRTPLRN